MFGTNDVFMVPPPRGSNLKTGSVNQAITQDTTIPITLASVPVNPTLSGHITDQNGAAIAGATVELNGGLHNTFDGGTDSSGFYSVTAPAGSYKLVISTPDQFNTAIRKSFSLAPT